MGSMGGTWGDSQRGKWEGDQVDLHIEGHLCQLIHSRCLLLNPIILYIKGNKDWDTV